MNIARLFSYTIVLEDCLEAEKESHRREVAEMKSQMDSLRQAHNEIVAELKLTLAGERSAWAVKEQKLLDTALKQNGIAPINQPRIVLTPPTKSQAALLPRAEAIRKAKEKELIEAGKANGDMIRQAAREYKS